MFLTEAEILDTPLSLNYTCQYFEKNKKNLEQFFQENQQKKFTILGCGSSYMLAKSTASLFASLPGTSANAIAAGDYIVDPLFWYEGEGMQRKKWLYVVLGEMVTIWKK